MYTFKHIEEIYFNEQNFWEILNLLTAPQNPVDGKSDNLKRKPTINAARKRQNRPTLHINYLGRLESRHICKKKCTRKIALVYKVNKKYYLDIDAKYLTELNSEHN